MSARTSHMRSGWLINQINPEWKHPRTTNVFEVREAAVHITAVGMDEDFTTSIEIQVGEGLDSYWGPCIDRCFVRGTSTENTREVIFLPGTYRIVTTQTDGLAVWYEENGRLEQPQINYNYHHPLAAKVDLVEDFFLIESEFPTGMDTGTTPWTPVYVRREYDEMTGIWGPYEYGTEVDDWSYIPVGEVVPVDKLEKRVLLGSEILPATAGPDTLTVPLLSNWASVEFVGNGIGEVDYARYSLTGVAPSAGAAYHRLHDGGYVKLHDPDLVNFVGEILQGDGEFHIFYYYDPKPYGDNA